MTELTKQQLDAISWGAPDPRLERKQTDLNTLLKRIAASYETSSGISVTPDSAMRAPTVLAVVNAVARRISISPVHVFQKSMNNGRERKERLPNHPVARLLARPNEWQTQSDFWLDATSALVRYGRFFAWKGRGATGPIRRLVPLSPDAVTVRQDTETRDVSFMVTQENGGPQTYALNEMYWVRGPARDFLNGNSPVMDVREAIALEIAAEQFGAAFFGNGAMPLIFFKFLEGHKGFATDDAEQEFINSFQEAFGGKKRFKGMLLPAGLDIGTQSVENDKAQFIETRKLLRTVIAGAFGVPPHLVGDLERATFNNVEQQDSDFVINVVLPYAKMFETAMERDLLTDQDRRSGIVIRFNLDAVQRADFKTRQEGLKIQREMGVINANDWRERENMNPISDDDGGEDYIRPMNMSVPGEEPPPPSSPPDEPPQEGDDDE